MNKADYRSFFFTIVQNSKTRGHRFKFVKNRSRVDIRKHFFSQTVVNEWNTLPEIVVESESVNSFKNNYDKYVSKDRRLLGLSQEGTLKVDMVFKQVSRLPKPL